MELTVRKGTMEDFTELKALYAYARQFMRDTGNPNQWKNTWPDDSRILEDLKTGISRVVIDGNQICGAFILMTAPEPAYRVIRDGAWLNDRPYVTLHRVASNGRCHGILARIVEEAEQYGKDIRIDTHEDNQVMQHLLKKYGFVRCGKVTIANGETRIAFQKSGK